MRTEVVAGKLRSFCGLPELYQSFHPEHRGLSGENMRTWQALVGFQFGEHRAGGSRRLCKPRARQNGELGAEGARGTCIRNGAGGVQRSRDGGRRRQL